MEFVHEDAIHFVVRSAQPGLYDNKGRLVSPSTRRLYAKFRRGTAPSYAVEFAEQRFGFRKKPAEIPVAAWVAHYDSVQAQHEFGWTDEEREYIEQRLLERGYDLVEKPKVAAPYLKYDQHRKTAGKRTLEHVIRDITATFETAGFDVHAAVAYERENLNDPQVIEALEALGAATEEEEAEPLIAA